jgi:hypothetical protein
MKRILLAAALVFHGFTLHGQQQLPPNFQLPQGIQLPPGMKLPPGIQFPPRLPGFADTGFLGMRDMAPDRGLVTKKEISTNSYTLALKFTNSTRTFTEVGPSEATMKVVRHLVEGRTYDFPKVFDEVLGKQPPPWPAAPEGAAPYPFGFEQTGRKMPFRARLVKKESTASVVSLELHCADGPRLTLSQSKSEHFKAAQRCAERLQEGETYEFPDALRAPTASGKKKPAQPSAELKLLESFIGEWAGPMAGQPDVTTTIRYLWKGDGQGIWKENKAVTKHGSTMQESAWLITYDPARKCYLETPTRPDSPVPVVEMRWDADAKTLSLLAVGDRREPDMVVGGTRTLTTPDRTDWRFTTTNTDGRIVRENSGSYTRVK